MTLVQFLVLLVVAGICGGIGQAITGYSRGGCLTSIALGFIGALLGTKLAEVLGMHEMLSLRIGDYSFPVLWSVVGATIFVAVIGFISRRRGTM
jgi:uncharacterized membrane protein YeaQ/YmgE (transglycosylase-associated protein family)